MRENIREHLHEKFEQTLQNLNPAQKVAVRDIAEPMLVIAGPGTGKTHILAARIAYILKETDTQPHNILCLTFTEAGVLAMRERLQSFIGAEAHKVHIFTFHSFCNTIIQDHLEWFGRYDMEAVSDLERVEIIREILDELPEENVLKKGRWDIYFHEKHLGNLFQQMKAEHWSVAHVEQQIDGFIQSIPLREEFVYQKNTKYGKKGELKEKRVENISQRAEKLRAGARLFPEYQSKMKARNRYDFEDMVLWVLKAFQKNKYLLRRYQEQYLYFLVDEFQDTNGSQSEVLDYLVRYWETPNVFVVGDDDQAIFEFQGARLKNIIDFQLKHQPKVVLLKENYRSSQHILNASERVIAHNQERIIREMQGLDKHLVARNKDFSTSTIRPRIIEYPNPMHEDTAVVQHIEKLHQEGFPLSEIAVIYAKHKQSRNIISLLEKKKIPYNTKRRVNILHLPIIQNIRTFLRYFYLEHERPDNGEELLFQMMHFEFLGIETEDIRKLSHFMVKNKEFSWREVIANPEQLEKLALKNASAILDLSRLLEELLADLLNIRLLSFLERFINRSGLLSFVLQHEEKTWLLQVVHTFFDFVRKETDKNPRLSIARLLRILENMDENHLPIGVNKTVFAEQGVHLLTAHGAKGLEFQVVFIIGAGKDWEGGAGHRFRFFMPDTLTGSNENTNELEARRRLFYVAMTRAKEQLYISFSAKNNEGKALQRTQFVDEIIENIDLGIVLEKITLAPEKIIDIQSLLLQETTLPYIEVQDKNRVDELLADFVLSVSAMNRYQDCPLSFYYEYVLRIPSIPNEAATYGTAMHHALKRLYDKMLGHPQNIFPEREDLVQFFEKEMQRRRHYFTKKGFERRLNMGQKNLKAYYTAHIENWTHKVVPEMDVRNVEYRGVPIKGSIDLVIHQGEYEAQVLDYKTGSHKESKLKAPTESKPLGGIYWRQLYFYKILYENYRNHFRAVTRGTISYLETDAQHQFPSVSLDFNAEHQQLVGEMIVETYQSIQKHDFYEGCGKPTCKWCNFVRQNVLVNSFSDEDKGDLDD